MSSDTLLFLCINFVWYMWGWEFTCPGMCVEVREQPCGLVLSFYLCESQELLSTGGCSKSLYLLSFFLQQVVTNQIFITKHSECEVVECRALNGGISITSPRCREHFGRGSERAKELVCGQVSFKGSHSRSDAAIELTNTPCSGWPHEIWHALKQTCQDFIVEGLLRLHLLLVDG